MGGFATGNVGLTVLLKAKAKKESSKYQVSKYVFLNP